MSALQVHHAFATTASPGAALVSIVIFVIVVLVPVLVLIFLVFVVFFLIETSLIQFLPLIQRVHLKELPLELAHLNLVRLDLVYLSARPQVVLSVALDL